MLRHYLIAGCLLIAGCSSAPQQSPYQMIVNECITSFEQSPEGRAILEKIAIRKDTPVDPVKAAEQEYMRVGHTWVQNCVQTTAQMRQIELQERNARMFGFVMGQQAILNNNRLLGYDRGY